MNMDTERQERKELQTELNKLRRESKEEYLKMMGIDIPKLRAFEKAIDTKYNKIITQTQKAVKIIGKEVTEQHKKSFARMQSIYDADAEATIAHPLDDSLLYMPCKYWFTAERELGEDGTINEDAHLYSEVNGLGSDSINTEQVDTWFKFSFFPKTTKTYCIKPFIYLNGHWLLWTWGGGCSSTGDIGSGQIKLTLKMQIDQLSTRVHETEKVILDQMATGGADYQSGFGYDSEVDGGLATRVELTGGDQAVIWVKCECSVQIQNHGKAIIDMQTSPYFYFKVPRVRWGWPTWKNIPWSWPKQS